jgi:hypothetical protein
MKKRMPGFNAESSVYKTRKQYLFSFSSPSAPRSSQVLPSRYTPRVCEAMQRCCMRGISYCCERIARYCNNEG